MWPADTRGTPCPGAPGDSAQGPRARRDQQPRRPVSKSPYLASEVRADHPRGTGYTEPLWDSLSHMADANSQEYPPGVSAAVGMWTMSASHCPSTLLVFE